MDSLSPRSYYPEEEKDTASDGVWDVLESSAGDPVVAKLYRCDDDNEDCGGADIFFMQDEDCCTTIVMATFRCDSGILRLIFLRGRIEPDNNGRIFVDEKVGLELPFRLGD